MAYYGMCRCFYLLVQQSQLLCYVLLQYCDRGNLERACETQRFMNKLDKTPDMVSTASWCVHLTWHPRHEHVLPTICLCTLPVAVGVNNPPAVILPINHQQIAVAL